MMQEATIKVAIGSMKKGFRDSAEALQHPERLGSVHYHHGQCNGDTIAGHPQCI